MCLISLLSFDIALKEASEQCRKSQLPETNGRVHGFMTVPGIFFFPEDLFSFHLALHFQVSLYLIQSFSLNPSLCLSMGSFLALNPF